MAGIQERVIKCFGVPDELAELKENIKLTKARVKKMEKDYKSLKAFKAKLATMLTDPNEGPLQGKDRAAIAKQIAKLLVPYKNNLNVKGFKTNSAAIDSCLKTTKYDRMINNYIS